MEVICYICNESTDDWRRNLTEIKSQHSNTPISDYIKRFLTNIPSNRNIYSESNCICLNCLDRIDDYDWMFVSTSEQEKQLKDLLLTTEASISKESPMPNGISILDQPSINTKSGLIKVRTDLMDVSNGLDDNSIENKEHINELKFFDIENNKIDDGVSVDDEDSRDTIMEFEMITNENGENEWRVIGSTPAIPTTTKPNKSITGENDGNISIGIWNDLLRNGRKKDSQHTNGSIPESDPTKSNRTVQTNTESNELTDTEVVLIDMVPTVLTALQLSRYCKKCSRCFEKKKRYEEHMLWHKTQPLKCRMCHHILSNDDEYEAHLNLHKDVPKGQCVFCDKKYNKKGSLLKHVASHSAPKFLCDLCGKKFYDMTQMSNHRKTHVETLSFKCPHCPKQFKTDKYLSIHRKLHTNKERPFSCSFCGFKFKRADHLRTHEKRHRENTKTEKCQVCPAAFEHRFYLKQHMKRIHGAEII